jgi:hypothetical protein
MKPLEKIKLIGSATALLTDLETVGMLKRIKLLSELTVIITKLGLNGPVAGEIDDTGAADTNINPTDGQKKSGNYKKGKVTVAGFDIRIENPKGSTRSGTDDSGDDWSTLMKNHYGFIAGTVGADKDPIDVFLGDIDEPTHVYIIDQADPNLRQFDEHKVMLGFASVKAAKAAYLANYSENWGGMGAVSTFTLDKFKQWIESGDTRTAIKYQDGSLVAPVNPSPKSTILSPSDYFSLDVLALKTAMFKASVAGHALEAISLVFDGWLTHNPQ